MADLESRAMRSAIAAFMDEHPELWAAQVDGSAQ